MDEQWSLRRQQACRHSRLWHRGSTCGALLYNLSAIKWSKRVFFKLFLLFTHNTCKAKETVSSSTCALPTIFNSACSWHAREIKIRVLQTGGPIFNAQRWEKFCPGSPWDNGACQHSRRNCGLWTQVVLLSKFVPALGRKMNAPWEKAAFRISDAFCQLGRWPLREIIARSRDKPFKIVRASRNHKYSPKNLMWAPGSLNLFSWARFLLELDRESAVSSFLTLFRRSSGREISWNEKKITALISSTIFK